MTVQNIAQGQMSGAMMRVASGMRVNSARDDAAGLAIMETMTAQVRGLDQGTRNTRDMQALANTAEGGLATVSDSLQRVRELSVQAANDTATPRQREIINQEIQQLAEGIEAAVGNTQYNGMNLLDGGGQGLHLASNADGTGMTVNVADMSGIAQAIANYNVTGSFDIGQVDAALDQVSDARASLGAYSNRMDYTARSNDISSVNLQDARSRVGDANMALEMMNVNQESVINQMQILLQRQNQDNAQQQSQLLRSPGAAGVR